MKIWKGFFRGLFGLLCLPVALLALYILCQAVGFGVNGAAASSQTSRLERLVTAQVPDAEILSAVSDHLNTGGTGDHVEIMSVVLFRSAQEITALDAALQEGREKEDAYCWVKPLGEVQEEAGRWQTRDLQDYGMKTPEDSTGCYLLYWHKSAPFSHNFEGC